MKCRKCRKEIPEESNFCLYCGAKQDITRNPKSRGNGTGSVYQLPNRTWIAIKTVSYETDKDGKLHRITRSRSGFKSKKDAVNALGSISTERRAPASTFLQVYNAWEPTHQASRSTMDCYRAAKKYFAPLYHIKMADITVDDLQECLDECPKGKRTQQNMKALCGLLYKYAIPRNLATLNMGQYITVHAKDDGRKDALPDEAVAVLEANAGIIPGADYILCQCYLGFRPSELLSLDASNYNREERAFVGGSKTDAGRDRIVTVSPKIQPIVDRLLKDKVYGPVFCAEDGHKMDLKVYRAMFYEVLERCGIENPVEEVDGVKRRKYTPHSCRHTFATMMKRVAGSDKDKLELMGHTSGEMLRHYQDVAFEDLRKITDAL